MPTLYFYPILESEDLVPKNLHQRLDETKDYVLYIHIPYCRRHCTFCPFHTKVTSVNDKSLGEYVNCLIEEMKMICGSRRPKVRSLYYGGGSPSILDIDLFRKLHACVCDVFDISDAEITFEGELLTLMKEGYLSALESLNINRISFGIQTFDDRLRRMFNMDLTASEVSELVRKMIREKSFRVNVDMMYGLPYQTYEGLKSDIVKVTDLGIDSVDYYRLHPYAMPKRQLGDWIDRANNSKIEYLNIIETEMERARFKNLFDQVFTKDDYVSDYNRLMWIDCIDIIGIGASARGCIDGISYMNEPNIESYLEKIHHMDIPLQKASKQKDLLERIRVFSPKKFYIDKELLIEKQLTVKNWMSSGWIEESNGSYLLTSLGKRFVDHMVIDLLPTDQYILVQAAENILKKESGTRTGGF